MSTRGSGDHENGLRDSSSLMEEESIEFTTPSNSPMSLSSCARLVQVSSSSLSSISRIKETPPSPCSTTQSNTYKTPCGTSKVFNSSKNNNNNSTTSNNGTANTPGIPVSSPSPASYGQSLLSSPQGQKLDLPMVYNNLKVDNFRGIKKEPGLVHKTRRKGVQDTVVKLMSLMNLADNPKKLPNLPNLDKNLKIILKTKPIVETYLADHQKRNGHSKLTFNSSSTSSTPTITSTTTATPNGNLTPSKLSSKAYTTPTSSTTTNNHHHLNKKSKGLLLKEEKEKYSEKLHGAFNWTRDYAVRDNKELTQMSEEWTEYEKGIKTPPSPKEISDLLLLPIDDLLKFKLNEFEDDKLSSLLLPLKNLVNHLVYPDILKMLAFAEWQKGNYAQCVYYTSESHGTHLRSDVVDKHCIYFGRKEEHLATSVTPTTTTSSSSNTTNSIPIKTTTSSNSSSNTKTSKNTNNNPNINNNLNKEDEAANAVQSKVFHRQIEDAMNFGKSMQEFQSKVNQIKFDWNIIQITALSFANNRFGSDIASWKETPALFLTSFQYLPMGRDKSQQERAAFTTFIKQPDVVPGASMQRGILEEFNKVMIKNRHINDGYQGCRKKYWDIRAEHNRHLSDVLASIEEHWIFPWSFLFPGNIRDSKIQGKIHDKINTVEDYIKRKLTSEERIVLYKLIENYQIVDADTKLALGKFLAVQLNISTTKGNGVSNLLNKSGILGEIEFDQKRGPTILILDQELEQLPWDWLPSLRNTSVTRMPSMASLYSALKVMKYTRPRYPEIIDMSKCTFILNPDQTLKNVQQRLEEYLKERKQWNGVIGRKPSHQEVEEALKNQDVLIYCGHGNGVGFYPEFALQKILCRATPILMGCSSGQYKYHGPKASSSSIVNSYFIAASPSVVGFLWEVTDVECDRVTVDLLQRWLPGPGLLPSFAQFDHLLERPREKSLASAVLRARKAATQFLTEASLVNYGLPIETK